MKKQRGNAEILMDILFPPKCVSCGEYLNGVARFLCPACEKTLFIADGFKRDKLACEGFCAPYFYEGAAKAAMGRLKFGSNIDVAPFFSTALLQSIRCDFFGVDFDIITCVPSTRSSIAKRGYNQAQVIAEDIKIDADFDPNLLKKRTDTGTQHLLDAYSRQKNIESAYALNRGRMVTGKTILLIDDILTTGATVNACARELYYSGAKAVYVACATVTRHEKEN